MDGQRIADIHHHVFPPERPVHRWDIDTDWRDMQDCGVTDVILSCPLETDHAFAHQMNLFLSRQVSENPRHYRMLGALAYDDVPAALEEIAFVMDELHAAGFGINTHNGAVYMGNDSLNPIFEELNRRGAVVFLHPCHQRAPGNEKILFTGNDSVYEYTFDTTRAVMDFVFQDKVKRWPRIRWILAHAGGTIPFLAHRMAISGRWGCIRQDEEEILRALKSFYYDLTLNAAEENYRFMKQFAGADHLLFGSDYPSCDKTILADSLRALQETEAFTPEEKWQILYGTASQLLG